MSESGGRVIRAEETQFKISDPGFNIDTRLTAIVEGNSYDFTGKKIFTAGFFRQSVGFGITSVDIEVNTSLQPVITITFKDLYGNAMFGKNINVSLTDQIGEAMRTGEGTRAEEDTNVSNFSVLFNWPPPKFLFTFKGFLGRQVSWMLSLKKTSTSYQSDGSYDIKCEFVPNQWGFMADLPFLFLLAVKGLKKNEFGPESEEFKKVQTIFDLIKIGKQVEIKTKEATKEFDVILKQMTLLKANRIVEAAVISKIIKFDELIDGKVGNLTIKGTPEKKFQSCKVYTPIDASMDTIENIKKKTSSSATMLRQVNTYLLLNSDIGGYPSREIALLSDITITGDVITVKDWKGLLPPEKEMKVRLKIITDNISIIEDAIKQKTFDSSKTQLRQITIGEVFKHLSMDAAYILGKILQHGYNSYVKNKEIRNSLSKSGEINGKQYPLIFDKTKEKKEIPATGLGAGVEDGELAFVDEFISAVSEGIAKDLIANQQAGGASAEVSLVKRINNIECIQGNPYSPFYRNIAENLMVRAGIIGYLTRSNDPNYPGDFDKSWGGDRDSIEEVLKLADADMENITTDMLSSMTDEEFLKLKQFCIFWNRFISTDGVDYLKNTSATTDPEEFDKPDGSVDLTSFGGSLPDSLINREVVIERDSDNKATLIKTLGQIKNEVFTPKLAPLTAGQSSESFDASNANFIDLKSFQATVVYNNKIIWSLPTTIVGADSYAYVIFEGTDATKAKESNNATSDSETRSKDPDAENTIFSNPVAAGLVPIDTYSSKDKPGEPLPRIKKINDRFETAVFKYSGMGYPTNKLFDTTDMNAYATNFDKECVYPTNAEIVDPNGSIDPTFQIPATNLIYSIAMHPNNSDQGVVFGPFYNGSNSSQNHRACIKQMCVTLLDKMNKLEEEKNKVISEVLGKATEQREGIYKQFNVLYHQWESLMFEDPNSDSCKDLTQHNPSDPTQISKDLEKKLSSHESTGDGQSYKTLESIVKNSFVYDYPLNRKANIDVRNSIINIDALYSPNGNTTVLNIIQAICTKNNFMFIPIPGNGQFNNYLEEIFAPQISEPTDIKNFFYVMFSPTPESRSTLSNDEKERPISFSEQLISNLPSDAYEVKVGSPDNKVFKGLTIDTNENKTTAESIVNLQRLVDKENHNKTVTTDCSMLPVMEGRSYKASFDMIGNAQIFPMQYFYLNSIPMFNGLYQVHKIKHNIKPNDMTTSAEGIRMRFDYQTGDFGGVPPVTLQTLEDLNVFGDPTESGGALIAKNRTTAENEDAGTPEATATSTVSNSSIVLPQYISGFGNSKILKGETHKSGGGYEDFKAFSTTDKKGNPITYTAEEKIKNINEFVEDILEPFAKFLFDNHPDLYKKVWISSTTRSYVPDGGATNSQHMAAQAMDFEINGGDFFAKNKENLRLLNAIIEFYKTTSYGYDQLLFETRKKKSCWIHWSYSRNHKYFASSGRKNELFRFVDDERYKTAPIETRQNKRVMSGSTADVVLFV